MEKINWLDYIGAKNPVSEAYRSITASLRAAVGKGNKLIEITSLTDVTEQSNVVAGLGVMLAQAGKRVLLIDMNFSIPTQHVLFDLPNRGLTDSVATGVDFHEMIQHCMEQENLDVLTCGSAEIATYDLPGSDTFQQLLLSSRNEYDFVLLDSSDIKTRADAIVTASKTDGVLLVVTSGEDKLNALIEAKAKLEQAGANVLGCILKKTRVN